VEFGILLCTDGGELRSSVLKFLPNITSKPRHCENIANAEAERHVREDFELYNQQTIYGIEVQTDGGA